MAGEWNLYSGHTRNRIRETKIGKIFLHPEFDLVNYNNDLALVFLEQELESDLGINSICLPSSNDAWDVSRCVIAGWMKEDGQGLLKVKIGECDDVGSFTTSRGFFFPLLICIKIVMNAVFTKSLSRD